MLATIELATLATELCPACGNAHRIRAALVPDAGAGAELMGFFARCPATGRTSWLVVRAPIARDGCSRLLRVGPPDDLEWEPVTDLAVDGRGLPSAMVRGVPPAGRIIPSTAAARLRWVLGCSMA
jgi:hypothetical protein